MSTITLSLSGQDALRRGLTEAPLRTKRELLSAMLQATLLLEREAKDGIPRGATGLTAASVTSDAYLSPLGVQGVVGSAMPSAIFVELGTKPHMPPVKALVPWVRAVLGLSGKEAEGVAYLVARKIARKGTPARRPFGNAFERNQGQVLRMFEDAATRVAGFLAGSAGGAA